MLFHAYLRRNVVYVPTVAKRDTAVYTDIEPVAVVSVAHSKALRRALLDAIARKNATIPVPKGKWPAPVLLKYAGVKSWSAFARDASLWSIEDDGGKYLIVGYRTHPKGYWEQDPDQKTVFPPGSTVDDVIERMIAILQDAVRP
jgi:hypothetical protein